ncbi:MAG: glycosyltransferase family 2 protein [Verrucomicrobiota bacterium]
MSAEGTPAISAVVPCRNELHRIEECVRSLLAQETPPGGFEIIIVDGMSDDGTREVLRRLASEDVRLRVVDNPLGITPCGMNCGIRAARGRWVAIMGSHNRYAPDYLVRCLEVAQATGVDNVGGAMVCEGKTVTQQAIAAAHHSPLAVGGAKWHNPDYEGPADTVFGGFYRREAFDRIGLFDEAFVRNQDDELNLRLTRAGGRIWHSPKIKSWYRPRNSLGTLFNQYMQYGYWKVRVIQKHKLPASWRHLVPGAFVLALLMLFLLSAFCFVLSAFNSHMVSGERSEAPALTSVLCLLSSVILGSLLALYGLCVMAASVITAAQTEWRLLPLLPIVFPCYHFGYGYGFLRGVWDFVVLRKGAASSFSKLTRPSSESPTKD